MLGITSAVYLPSVKWMGWTRWENGRMYIRAFRHSCCLIMQMIWKAEVLTFGEPCSLCVRRVKCCWAFWRRNRSHWDQTRLDLLSEYILTNQCATFKHSSDCWCWTPSRQSSKALLCIGHRTMNDGDWNSLTFRQCFALDSVFALIYYWLS